MRNRSLVAKSWISSSRRRLFETVLITRASRQSWLDNISPSNTGPLRHVRSFRFFGSGHRERGPSSKYADFDDLHVYFPSLCRLHTIDLSYTHISSDIPQQIEMFSSCQQVLSSLIFITVSLPWRSFITIIDYFPNLRYLKLRSLSFEDTNRNPPPLSGPLCGKLCYLSEEEYLIALSNWFTGLEVEYEELEVEVGYVSGMCSQRIVATCARTLKRLKFQLCECRALGRGTNFS